MMIYEVTGANKEQREKLKTFGETQRIDRETVNVVVEDENVDDINDWLEHENLEHRSV